MAYGEEGRPTIPPNSVLIFDIKLHEIMNSVS
jgi:FKBP-type peptidyl-prolyl cis-trans isomerase